MQLLLLVCALALLANQTARGSPLTRPFYPNLNHIIDLVEKVNKTLIKKDFVKDVQNLFDAGCKDDFFCRVHQILNQRQTFQKMEGRQEMVMNLEKFINGTEVNCPVILKKMKTSDVSRPLEDLLQLLTACIQRRNFIRESFMKPNDRNAPS